MEAVEHLIKRGFQPTRTVYLAYGHDEEIGGKDGAKQVRKISLYQIGILALTITKFYFVTHYLRYCYLVMT
jgi:acetylornithine deacetylase/succinyl-diaminopimelate desuccinylase-like protein